MAYGVVRDLPRRAASDRLLRDKAFSIAKSSKHDRYHRGLASMVYKIFDKESDSLALSKTLATRDKSSSIGGIKRKKIYCNS